MKIVQDWLNEGDYVEASITHEIKIDGESSWIKLGVSSRVQPGETAEKARKRVSDGVNDGVLATVRETVETVRKATS